MRQLSEEYLRIIRNKDINETLLVLVEFIFSEENIVRIAAPTIESIEHDGETYSPYPFHAALPNEVEDQIPYIDLELFSIEPDMRQELLDIGPESFQVKMRVVRGSNPEEILAGPLLMDAVSTTSNSLDVISVRLRPEPTLRKRYPRRRVTPSGFPAAWEYN